MADMQNLIADLMVKVAQDEPLSEKEAALLEQWCSLSDEHRAVPELLREKPWLEQEDQTITTPIPSEAIWADLVAYIEKDTAAVVALPRRGIRWRVVAVVAASVLVILAGWRLYPSSKKQLAQQTTAPAPPPSPVSLSPGDRRNLFRKADGSLINLDKVADGSLIPLTPTRSLRKVSGVLLQEEGEADPRAEGQESLRVGFGKKKIVLQLLEKTKIKLPAGSAYTYSSTRSDKPDVLTGAGLFDVGKIKEKPRRIHYGGKDIEVVILGTCFGIDTLASGDLKLGLVSGAVKVIGAKASVTLKPDRQVVLHDGRPVTGPLKDSSGLMAWSGRSHVFKFDNTPLGKVLLDIGHWYGLKIYNPKGLIGLPVSGDRAATKDPKDLISDISAVQSRAVYLTVVSDSILVSPTPFIKNRTNNRIITIKPPIHSLFNQLSAG
jgi:ferric-dicitrate binding protein FerR (iron transport regulator)